ncbi:MAG: ArnT family glycosyltransferase [Vicinamibacterales bacterium]
MTRPPRAALALVLAAYVAPLLVAAPLMEDDEGLHAAIAQEMVERGDWTVPRLLGEPFLDKPILYFWLEAGSIAVFGASEFAVRLPGTLVALAGAAATGWLTGALAGSAAGLWAAAIYATMLLPFGVSLSPLHDLVMVPLVVVAVGAYWHARHAAGIRPLVAWTVLAGIALGLSMLGKGLTGVGLAGVGVATWLVWTRALSWRLVAVGIGSLLLGAIVAWPWYAAMEQASPGYLAYFFADRHLGGMTTDTQRHAGRPFWYYLPIVVGGTLPWSVTLWRRFRPATDAERLLWAWLAADVLLLSVAGSKLATYVLPALPAVAALCAWRLVGSPGDGRRGLAAAAVAIAAFGMAAAPGVALWLGGASRPGWPVLATGLLPAIVLVWAQRAWPAAAPARLLAATAALLVVVAVGALPLVAGRLTARPLAAEINRRGELPPRLYVVDEGIGSFVFYLQPELRRGLTADRIQRVSRFSLADVAPFPGAMVAVASDRMPGVAALYELPGPPPAPSRGFELRPLDHFRPRAR